MLIIAIVLIISAVIIIRRKRFARQSLQDTVTTPQQVPVVRYTAYPPGSQQATPAGKIKQLHVHQLPHNTYVIYSVMIDTEYASVDPSTSTYADKKDDPDLPPYNPSYWNTDASADNQSTIRSDISLVQPPTYSSVVPTTTTVPVPPAADS